VFTVLYIQEALHKEYVNGHIWLTPDSVNKVCSLVTLGVLGLATSCPVCVQLGTFAVIFLLSFYQTAVGNQAKA